MPHADSFCLGGTQYRLLEKGLSLVSVAPMVIWGHASCGGRVRFGGELEELALATVL